MRSPRRRSRLPHWRRRGPRPLKPAATSWRRFTPPPRRRIRSPTRRCRIRRQRSSVGHDVTAQIIIRDFGAVADSWRWRPFVTIASANFIYLAARRVGGNIGCSSPKPACPYSRIWTPVSLKMNRAAKARWHHWPSLTCSKQSKADGRSPARFMMSANNWFGSMAPKISVSYRLMYSTSDTELNHGPGHRRM